MPTISRWTVRLAAGPALLAIVTLLAVTLAAVDAPAAAAKERRPNFVVLFADDLGYGDLGSFGHPTIATPNLDRMAAEGLKLTSFYAMPLCTPSRAALLTGRYPMRSGLYRVLFPPDTGGMPASEVTLAEALRGAGYRTAAIGKWHLGHRAGFLPTDNGFDHYYGLLYSNDMGPPKGPPLRLYRDGEAIEGEVDQGALTESYTREAVRFIEEARRGPFFLYLAYTMPHVPVHASDRFAGRSRRGLYGDAVETIDWSVGEVLRALHENGIERDTLVLFTSDNGPALVKDEEGGSAGEMRGGKGSTYEGGVREPCVVRWPGRIAAARINADPASTLDLLPTLLELGGAEPPRDRPLDGRSLVPLLDGKALAEHPYYYFKAAFLEGVRAGRWKLRETQPQAAGANASPAIATFVARSRDEGRVFTAAEVFGADAVVELFDLEADPSERFNVATAHPDIVERLRGQMTAFAHAMTPGPAFEVVSREERPRRRGEDGRGGATTDE
jgi:arylsulfatase A-like enzyme